jgi:WD40 repeat protein
MVSDVEVEGIFDMGFNSDGRFLWTVGENHQVWETATGQLVAQVGNVQGTSALSPDGRYLAVQDENGVMSLWDVPFRNLRFTKGLGGQDVPDPGPPRQVFRGHTGLVRTLDFSPDSQYLVSASEDRTARIWRVASGEAVAVLEGHTGNVTDARFSPDGKLVVTAGEDGTVRLWDSSTGGGILVLHGHVGVVRGARFSPDSKLVLTEGDDGTARVWSVAKDEPATILEGHVGDVHSLTFARDGRFLATGGEDGTARVWEVGTGTRIAVLSHRGSVSSVSFDPSGSQLATASEGMGKVWDLKAEETTAILRPLDPVRSMALGPAGKSLVTGGLLGVAVWERTPNGFRELQSWRELSSSNGLREVEIVRFSRDGNFVVAVGRHEAWAARVVSNGRLRVIGSTGQFAGTESDPIDADITPDGRALAIAGEDGTARLFDVGADEFLSLYDHPASVSSVGLSPDGRFLATGCADGLVRVWDVETGHVIASWGEKGRPILGVAFSPDGTRVAAVGENGLVRLDQCLVCGSLQELLSVARSRAPRTLTSAERARYLHEN